MCKFAILYDTIVCAIQRDGLFYVFTPFVLYLCCVFRAQLVAASAQSLEHLEYQIYICLPGIYAAQRSMSIRWRLWPHRASLLPALREHTHTPHMRKVSRQITLIEHY